MTCVDVTVGVWFKEQAEQRGFNAVVKERDSGEPIAAEVAKPSHKRSE